MATEQSIFYMCLLWYFYTYGPPHIVRYYLHNIYFFIYASISKVLNFNYYESSIETSTDTINEINNIIKPEIKYEDKYLDIIRKISNEWQFTKDEIKEKKSLVNEILNNTMKNLEDRIIEIDKSICELNKEINNDNNTISFIENCNEFGDELIEEVTLEERNKSRKEQIDQLIQESIELKQFISSEVDLTNLINNSEQQANDIIINKRIDKLSNCYVMEKTPQGNVIMCYNKERESFTYYSDSTIPYRYLEVVGRKFVKILNCRPLFVDMETELKLVEEKWTKEYELKKEKELKNKMNAEEAAKNNKSNQPKKNVFAKFKDYNKNNGVQISMAAPPKNSFPSKQVTSKEDEKILLKERANRYTYEGKIANFNFLQKIDRKVFNKKLGFSFADFKKMNSI